MLNSPKEGVTCSQGEKAHAMKRCRYVEAPYPTKDAFPEARQCREPPLTSHHCVWSGAVIAPNCGKCCTCQISAFRTSRFLVACSYKWGLYRSGKKMTNLSLSISLTYQPIVRKMMMMQCTRAAVGGASPTQRPGNM